jgi:folate-binding protein YgfZ
MNVSQNMDSVDVNPAIGHFPFDIIKFVGQESVDFLQRITTNDFNGFSTGKIQKTLLVTDKGRILDAVWVIHHNDYLLMLVSQGMASEIIVWLNKFIIMEDISLSDVSNEFEINIHFEQNKNFYHTDYFGFSVSFELRPRSEHRTQYDPTINEQWRIENGIPVTKKELIQDFNPLELNLWAWISFTKGCYIGQEIIARLDTYNKIQRTLCLITASDRINEKEILLDDNGSEIGKITSIHKNDTEYIGLAVIRVKSAVVQQKLKTADTNVITEVRKVFQKVLHGRN